MAPFMARQTEATLSIVVLLHRSSLSCVYKAVIIEKLIEVFLFISKAVRLQSHDQSTGLLRQAWNLR